MPTLLFPDNTVLINFAILDDGMGLLGKTLAGTGTWCATIARECEQSSHHPGLEDLAFAGDFLGEPLFPDAAEHVDTRTIRDSMARPGDGPDKHLGEAETLAVIGRRRLTAVFVTDDRGARDHAGRLGIATVSTWDLLRSAFRRGLLDEDQLWRHLESLRSHDRGGPPRVRTRADLPGWLT